MLACIALLIAAPAHADPAKWTIEVTSATEAMVDDVKLSIQDIPGYLRGADPELKKFISIRVQEPDATPYKIVNDLIAGLHRVGYTRVSLTDAKPARKHFDADKIAALLNKPSPDGGVLAAITDQLKACSKFPGSAGTHDVPTVTVRFNLDTAGSLTGPVAVIQPVDDPLFKIAAEASATAVKACSPFKLPPDRYDLWKTVTWKFEWSKIIAGDRSSK